MLLVTVNDNGEGISPNNRARIFDSFSTTRREHGGTGMGLAIVRAMLEAHGGTIRLIDSEAGATFELTIPIADTALS
jgi:signal transduction histidine kinase